MFIILTVLYNKTIDDSATLQGILKSSDILNAAGSKLLLWDNSPKKMPEDTLRQLSIALNNFEYVHTPANLALSQIFNSTIQNEVEANNFKYLMLLDDDSDIELPYFEKAINAANRNYPLIIPIVKNRGIIRSPMRSYIIKGFPFSHINPGVFSSKNLMAINSGMIISFDFLRTTNFQYDKRLRNYATDSYFMKFYASKHKTLYILNYTFNHSLSFFDNEDITRKLTIFKQTKRSFLIIHSDSPFNFIMAITYNFMSSLKHAIKHKNLQFFK